MEGILTIPPDRGTIIGRALWKPRFVVVGSPQRDLYQPNLSVSQVFSTDRIKNAKDKDKKDVRPLQKLPPDAVYLSVYKSKDDWDAVQQHSIASITECRVYDLAHPRKQGPVLPTLVIQISPDPATDKLRKRRSSRTAGLTSMKESGPMILWFRPGEDQYSLYDWARYINAMMQPGMSNELPMSPISPASPTFVNPFSPRERERAAAEYFPRPSSGHAASSRPSKHFKHFSKGGRERPKTFTSESTSMKSGRSDVSSSQASSMNPAAMGYPIQTQNYTAILPGDIPSPATTVGENPGDSMFGWTSAQGRSSVLSSPVRGRGSIGSQGQTQSSLDSSSPAVIVPRETILDRAFQLGCIPGSERDAVPGEEKLTSLARFDALIREAEARRKQEKHDMAATAPMTSTWEEDEDSDEADLEDEVEKDEGDTDEDAFEENVGGGRTVIGPNTQRALSYIANRHSSMSQSGRTNQSDSYPLDSASSILRPHTAHSKSKPSLSQAPFGIPGLETSAVEDCSPPRPHHEKRHSTSSVRRLSFNDLTRRLSSTSSLLLVQTNASNASSRCSGEIEAAQQTILRGAPTSRPGLAPHPTQELSQEERCHWRGSFGRQTGFI